MDKLILGLTKGPLSGLIGGLMCGLGSGSIGGLIGGFQPVAQELKTRPNQGIWLTIHSSIKIGLPTGIVLGALLGLLFRSVPIGFGIVNNI
ncbi:MAG: hypothetical protein AAF702_23270 [Chloroflexota bacterium]